ncbi:MAG: hypothetical protein H6R00_476 [Proteobacteria bacterium]|nr:hypothetical protein [Pseudomonadota bacterium]
MISNDIFADNAAIDADLDVYEAMLWSRFHLLESLVSESRSREENVIDLLRVEPMYQFVEFFYLLKARSIETVDDISQYVEAHNYYIDMLTRDGEKMKRMGLRKDRLLDAIFTADTLPRLIETWKTRPGVIEQSNLGRFLVAQMSSETCRKLIIASTEAGFLDRTKSPYGAMLVRSTGVFERIFGNNLRELRDRITGIGGNSPASITL